MKKIADFANAVYEIALALIILPIAIFVIASSKEDLRP